MAYSMAGRWTAEAGAAVGSAGASAGAAIAPADEEEEVSHWVVHFIDHGWLLPRKGPLIRPVLNQVRVRLVMRKTWRMATAFTVSAALMGDVWDKCGMATLNGIRDIIWNVCYESWKVGRMHVHLLYIWVRMIHNHPVVGGRIVAVAVCSH